MAEDFRHLFADADRRVEGASGVLVDHRDAVAPDAAQLGRCHREEVASLEQHVAGGQQPVPGQVAEHGHGEGRLAAAGFSDKAIGLARLDDQRDVADGIDQIAPALIADGDVVEFEQGRCHGSRYSLSPSAASPMATTTQAMPSAGNRTVQGAVVRRAWFSLTIRPQSGVGG